MKPFVRSLRKGFTLPEVLVTVAVISVLAAAVVPTVVNQVTKGDLPALQADLNAIRAAIGNFTTDVHHYPATMTQLAATTAPTGTDDDIAGVDFGTGVSGWHGPYLTTKAALSSTVLFKTSALHLTVGDALISPATTGFIAITILAEDGTSQISAGDASLLKSYLDGNALSATPPSGYNNGTACTTTNGGSGMVRITGTATVSGATGTDTGGSCVFSSVSSVKILLVQTGK